MGRFELRKYEYLYIIDPQEDVTRQSIEHIKEQYREMGLNLLKEEEMGKRRLAYDIKKKTDGFYYVTQVEIDDIGKLRDFEKDLKVNPNVLRFMKIRL